MKCGNCLMDVIENKTNCPLCGKFLKEQEAGDDNGGAIISSTYPKVERIKKNNLAKHTMLFIFIAVSLVSLFVDYSVSGQLTWSIIVAAGLYAAIMFIGVPFITNKCISRYILDDVFWCSVLVVVVDYSTSKTGWALSIVVPALIAGGFTLILIIALTKKQIWSQSGVYMLELIFMNIFVLILGFLDFYPYIYASAASLLYCFICLLGMKFFLDGVLKNELSKRFHL